MSRRPRFLLFLTLSIACLLLAALLAAREHAGYRAQMAVLPPGTRLADIPVGGLDPQAGAARVAQVYSLTPVELRYGESRIQIDPLLAGQSLDLNAMLSAAAGADTGFWSYLMDRQPPAGLASLRCSVDETRLRAYLMDLLDRRYGTAPTPARPVLGDVSFLGGQPGEAPQIDSALPAISAALCSSSSRVVVLAGAQTPALPPDLSGLRGMLETLVQVSAFDGALELYFQDLSSGEEIRLAWSAGRSIAPDIAFTAASTIKIPVMVSAYRRLEGEMPVDLQQQMALMIDLSDNGSTDEVMQRVLDSNIAPVQVTQDVQNLGLDNTFLAGFFYPGAPLLNRYETPANRRGDISTDPDIYNQTTATDMGRLLAAIQRCAVDGSGPLAEAFPGEVTQPECQSMVDLLSKNRKGVLIEAGVPEGTRVAHKYGWVSDPVDGLMHQASDAAIVFTPGGDFILTVYLFHPQQLQWEPSQRLVARLAAGIVNFYNQWR